VTSTQEPFSAQVSLIDRDLELILPDVRFIEPLLAACTHPLTHALQPDLVTTSRAQVLHVVRTYGMGYWPGDALAGIVGGYQFWMKSNDPYATVIAGGIGLRIANTPDIEQYYGHIGYHVYPPARGRHYAERASRLLLPIARAHGLSALWITTNPDNYPSRRTCEHLGAVYVETVNVPHHHPLYMRGDRKKCRYRLPL
jgi:tagatose 1,6-diphosphate aldolase